MSDTTENTTEDMGYTIQWLGYNDQPNYDRIWGHIQMDDSRNYVFWGVAGKRQQFKEQSPWRIEYLISQMEHKGYAKIEPRHFERLFPGFHEDLEVWLMTNILGDTMR